MRYKQWRLAKRKNGELIQQCRYVESKYHTKWYKPWHTEVEYEYGEWIDLPFVEIEDDDGSGVVK